MNRKQVLSGATIAAFTVILLTWAPSTAYAGVDNSADVETEFAGGCIVLDENRVPTAADLGKFVQNKKTGMVSCHAFGVTNNSGEDQTFGGGCQITGKHGQYFGTYVNEIIDNGDGTANITLTCHAKAPV